MQKNMNRILNNFVVFNKLLLSNLCNITRNKKSIRANARMD